MKSGSYPYQYCFGNAQSRTSDAVEKNRRPPNRPFPLHLTATVYSQPPPSRPHFAPTLLGPTTPAFPTRPHHTRVQPLQPSATPAAVMRSPRPVRSGAAAEDSDWEPSDGEEGDDSPRMRSPRPPSSCGDPGGAEASVDAKRTPRPCRTRVVADGDVGEGCDVFSRMRGRRSRSASGDADGADSPVDHERAPSETRDDIHANNCTRQPSKFITRSSPSPARVCGTFCVKFHSMLGLGLGQRPKLIGLLDEFPHTTRFHRRCRGVRFAAG
jgi:hypothetical protein